MTAMRIFMTVLIAGACLAGQQAAVAQVEDPVGNVAAIQGEAYAIRTDQIEVDLTQGEVVFRADVLQTLAASVLDLEMIDGSRFTLDENTRVALSEYVTDIEPRGRFGLLRGRLRSVISETFSSRADSFEVVTNEAVMGVQGTDFQIEAVAFETRIYVYEGLVLVTSRDPNFPEGVLLGPGQFTTVRLGEPIEEPIWFTPEAALSLADMLRSGGDLMLRSGGDQGNDPIQEVPEITPVFLPPEPNLPLMIPEPAGGIE